jgi:carotenoid 1,2-hydratase
MIEIGGAGTEVDPGCFTEPGGFAWWYVDLVNPRGDGAVLIWSCGLPFLPGNAASGRRGEPMPARQRPSVNLAVYREGKPVFYLLQEYGAGDVEFGDGGISRIGGCRFRRGEGGVLVDVELDCPIPGSPRRLRGSMRVEGIGRLPDAPSLAGDPSPHVWTPLSGPASGTLQIGIDGDPGIRVVGRAYHDRNSGRVPLDQLGIARWMWGRFPFGDREVLYYLVWPVSGGPPRCIGVSIDSAGGAEVLEDLSVERSGTHRTWGGMRWWERVRVLRGDRPWLSITQAGIVDSGPFYLRFLSRAEAACGEWATGWGELCEPDRIDLALHRPLVNMRVHRVSGTNSCWLPLFSGPRSGRPGRFLRHLLQRTVR